MNFPDDPESETLVGKVCLVLARVEQEGGHVVMAAHGNWGSMSTDYLDYSSNSANLHDWLKAVWQAYPEVKDELSKFRSDLRELKKQRDEWAHSAPVIDLWLMMKERNVATMTDCDIDYGKLLNGKKRGHLDAPRDADVQAFVQRASEVGDAATRISVRLGELARDGVRPVCDPRTKERGCWLKLKRTFSGTR